MSRRLAPQPTTALLLFLDLHRCTKERRSHEPKSCLAPHVVWSLAPQANWSFARHVLPEASPRIGTNEGSLALHVLSGVSPLNPILHGSLFLTSTEVHKGDSLHRSKKSSALHFLGVSPHILSGASPRPACLLEPRPACQMELRSACLLKLCPYKRKELRPACPLEPRPAK